MIVEKLESSLIKISSDFYRFRVLKNRVIQKTSKNRQNLFLWQLGCKNLDVKLNALKIFFREHPKCGEI